MKSPYQVMPDLARDEYLQLKADIAKRGVLVPIEFDEDGNVLDGHHRLRVCQELGITDFPTVTRSGMSEQEKMDHARRLNLARRHLTPTQKRRLIAAALRETPMDADSAIAHRLRVAPQTVQSVREDLKLQRTLVRGRDGSVRKERQRTQFPVRIVFSSDVQVEIWEEFVEYIEKKYPDTTFSSGLIRFCVASMVRDEDRD